MKTAANVQEHAEDIYAEAQQINEERVAQEGMIYGTGEQEAEAGKEETE